MWFVPSAWFHIKRNISQVYRNANDEIKGQALSLSTFSDPQKWPWLCDAAASAVSVTLNQPLMQASETHTSLDYNSIGRGGYYGRAEKASRDGLATHSKCLCVIIHPPRQAIHFHSQSPFLLWSIQNQDKRLLNLIGWKIWWFCFWWRTGATVHT